MIRRPPRSTLFPYTRSSDLPRRRDPVPRQHDQHVDPEQRAGELDRKSTRLNSSHPSISYAVFCLKKQEERLPGDFVECGVDTGVMSVAICEWLDFNRLDKDFWFFLNYEGTPDSHILPPEGIFLG